MVLKVNNQSDPRQIGQAPQLLQQPPSPARNGTFYVMPSFGRYNPPTVPVGNPNLPGMMHGQLPGMNPQRTLPIYMPNDGSPQGDGRQLQPQLPSYNWGAPWNANFVPLLKPRYQINRA